MKILYLMRHGKSDWTDPDRTDLERPLKKRGRKAARDMGRFFLQAGVAPDLILTSPDLILTSPAARAAETARLFEAVFEEDIPTELLTDLYVETADWQRLKAGFPEGAGSLLLVGHNPFLEELAASLLGAEPGRIRMVTAAAVRISFDVDSWAEARPGEGVLEWSLAPRLLSGPVSGASEARKADPL